jgi:disulfide bond formation protein DsbB
LILLIIIGLMSYGLYSQYVLHLDPCPLCMTQRIFYCLVGALALLAALHTGGNRIYSGLMLLAAGAGAAAAGRQVWLQYLPPDQVPACGPSLEYMLETFPFADTLKALVLGDGNCAEVSWTFLGFSMGEWSLAWFVALGAAALWQLLRRPT